LIVLATIAVALYRRRWRLAIAAAVCPLLAMGLARLLKPLFGRERQGAFAYPSGHSTTVVVVMGMVVFTDTVGGLLLGTAIVCVVALISARAPHRTRGLHRRPHRT
jgi:membrane-associated phospholipid phosphatase